MYECIQNNVDFVLAGSVRDDGPMPDVITDTAKAQLRMRSRSGGRRDGPDDRNHAPLHRHRKHAEGFG